MLHFVNENGNAITAIATVLLTIVTAGLGWIARQQFITTRAQLRAYVFQESAGLFDGSQMSPAPAIDRTNQPGVVTVIRNFGRTPASNVVHWAQLDVVETHREESLISPLPTQTAPATYLAPNATSTKSIWLNRPLSDQEKNDIFVGRRAIYLYGRIDYTDSFGQPHFTTNRLNYTNSIYPPVGPGGLFNFSTNGNTAK